jgi:hypothetical protein
MGTRADFYVGTGKDAEWIGSITWDGYPEGNPAPLFLALDEADFRVRAAAIVADGGENGGTRPDEGWPWPWKDSGTTDYSYAWTADGVRVSRFGRPWVTREECETEEYGDSAKSVEHPDMSARRAADIMAKSGLIIVTARG